MPRQEAIVAPAPCDICGGGDSVFLFTSFGYRIVRCTGCGLLYVAPRPTPEQLAEHYRADAHWGGEPQRATEARSQLLYRQVLRLLPPGAHVLDVGCSFGVFLRILRDAGHRATGIELSAPAAAAARAGGFTVHERPLEELALPGGSLDAVAMLNVVEHLPAPLAACREAYRLLRPGGVLVMVTPNTSFALPVARAFARLSSRRSVDSPMVQKVSQLRAPNHLFFYTPRTFAALVRAAGFEACELRHAAPILNKSLARRAAKTTVWLAAEAGRALTRGGWLGGYSLLAVGRKRAGSSA